MTSQAAKVNPAPFLFADACLLALAAAIIFKSPAPFTAGYAFAATLAVAAGGLICVWPWVLRHRGELKMAETDALASTVAQVRNIEAVASQIASATQQWQTAHEHANASVTAARDVARQITGEAKGFAEFLQRANDSEKAHLRLEVEKLRRAEGDWLQVLVIVLDHIFALHQAAIRSGQAGLIEQISQFRSACLDAARRVGLVGMAAEPCAAFDPQMHEPFQSGESIPENARVAGTVASGYRFQGQLIRKVIVALDGNAPAETPAAPEQEPTAEPSGGEGERMLL